MPWDINEVSEEVVVKYIGVVLKTTKVKKILGTVLDSSLNCKEHIEEKSKIRVCSIKRLVLVCFYVSCDHLLGKG